MVPGPLVPTLTCTVAQHEDSYKQSKKEPQREYIALTSSLTGKSADRVAKDKKLVSDIVNKHMANAVKDEKDMPQKSPDPVLKKGTSPTSKHPPKPPPWVTDEKLLPGVYKQVLEASLVDGHISTERLYPILMLSGLPKDLMGHICNKITPGQLATTEFYQLLGLVALAQHQFQIESTDILSRCPQPPVPLLSHGGSNPQHPPLSVTPPSAQSPPLPIPGAQIPVQLNQTPPLAPQPNPAMVTPNAHFLSGPTMDQGRLPTKPVVVPQGEQLPVAAGTSSPALLPVTQLPPAVMPQGMLGNVVTTAAVEDDEFADFQSAPTPVPPVNKACSFGLGPVTKKCKRRTKLRGMKKRNQSEASQHHSITCSHTPSLSASHARETSTSKADKKTAAIVTSVTKERDDYKTEALKAHAAIVTSVMKERDDYKTECEAWKARVAIVTKERDVYKTECEAWKAHTPTKMWKIGSHIVPEEHVVAIKGGVYDDVLDAYIDQCVQGRDMICCIRSATLSSFLVLENSNVELLQKIVLPECRYILGGILSANHWRFMNIDTKRKELTYMDPAGEETVFLEKLKKSWIKLIPDGNKWTWPTLPHSKQIDQDSCGIYVMQYAENFIREIDENVTIGQLQNFSWNYENVKNKRYMIYYFLESLSLAPSFEQMEL